jgi:hypothetical protein
MRLTSLLEMPAARPQGGDEVVDLAGAHAVHVGLHHHREQRPVDAPAPLEDRREEAALAQLGNLQAHVAGLGGEQPVPAAVALGRAGGGALVVLGADVLGADVLGRLGVDQGLEHELDALADDVDVATGADRVQQLGHVRLSQGHRVLLQARLWRSSRRSPGGPTSAVDGPGFYTTPWDVNVLGSLSSRAGRMPICLTFVRRWASLRQTGAESLRKEPNMSLLADVVAKPLGRLLEAVDLEVFSKRPRTAGLRDLQRDMSTLLQKLRVNREYLVLTNRGAPSFLLIPIDPQAWTSLLVAAAPDTDFEMDKARKQQEAGAELPDTDAVLSALEKHPRLV